MRYPNSVIPKADTIQIFSEPNTKVQTNWQVAESAISFIHWDQQIDIRPESETVLA